MRFFLTYPNDSLTVLGETEFWGKNSVSNDYKRSPACIGLILLLTKGELDGVIDISSGIGIPSYQNSTHLRTNLRIATLNFNYFLQQSLSVN